MILLGSLRRHWRQGCGPCLNQPRGRADPDFPQGLGGGGCAYACLGGGFGGRRGGEPGGNHAGH
eukprot:10914325-Alexandrium_andersonii.AAC.1